VINLHTVSVIIAAAGNAERMNGENKQLKLLCGIPVIIRSMLVFEKIDDVSEIIISARECDIDKIISFSKEYNITKLKTVVIGGETRQQSVINALKDVSKETELIAVHDGARPLVSAEHIKQCIKDAAVFGASTLGVPVKDTLKVVDGGLIVDTPDRRKLYITQTPQIFRKKEYYAGVNFAKEHELDFTDDCQLAEAVGVKVNMTLSDYKNIKLTTPEDFAVAEAILNMGSEQVCSE
jgi:2-C-methyl-D-erythritol 4-phosphate cytidylyltransferase